MYGREFAFYVLNQLEHRHYGGEDFDEIIRWMDDFASYQEEDGERLMDAGLKKNAKIIRGIRAAYVDGKLNAVNKYINEI